MSGIGRFNNRCQVIRTGLKKADIVFAYATWVTTVIGIVMEWVLGFYSEQKWVGIWVLTFNYFGSEIITLNSSEYS